jgi:hypothetical protein
MPGSCTGEAAAPGLASRWRCLESVRLAALKTSAGVGVFPVISELNRSPQGTGAGGETVALKVGQPARAINTPIPSSIRMMAATKTPAAEASRLFERRSWSSVGSIVLKRCRSVAGSFGERAMRTATMQCPRRGEERVKSKGGVAEAGAYTIQPSSLALSLASLQA